DMFQGVGANGEPCVVELFSGPLFRSVLKVKAKIFIPKTAEVMEHWHLQAEGAGVELCRRDAVPVGIDPAEEGQREEMKKAAKDYIQALLSERAFAQQLTDVFQHTDLTKRILRTVQTYLAQTDVSELFPCEPPPLDRTCERS